jgi:hypothetical protein
MTNGYDMVNQEDIYTIANTLTNQLEDVHSNIDEINNKLNENAEVEVVKSGEITYELNDPHSSDKILIDENAFTELINNYFSSLRGLQFLDMNLTNKLNQIEQRQANRDNY